MTKLLKMAVVAIAACAPCLAQYGPNLVANPGADAGAGSPTGYTTVPIPSWTGSGAPLTAIPWSVAGLFPGPTTAGPPDRGVNYFAGGDAVAVASAYQVVSVAAYAASIDSGTLGYQVSGWFGGFASQDDRAKINASFRDALDVQIADVTIGDVTAAERSGVTALLYRFATGTLPVGTRNVRLTLTMTRFAGTYNDGYADSLAFRLGSGASAVTLGSGCGGVPVATLAASAPSIGFPFAIALSAAHPGASGQCLVSGPPAAATPIGGGCAAYLDLGSYSVLAPVVTNGSGSWSLGLTIPFAPALNGVVLVMQAYVAPGNGPFGLDITNGVLLTIGI